MNYLINNFPNKLEIISLSNYGELQRFHMDYLISNVDYFNNVAYVDQGTTIFTTFHYGFRMTLFLYQTYFKAQMRNCKFFKKLLLNISTVITRA